MNGYFREKPIAQKHTYIQRHTHKNTSTHIVRKKTLTTVALHTSAGKRDVDEAVVNVVFTGRQVKRAPVTDTEAR